MIQVIDNILFEMLVCAYLCISVSRYFKILFKSYKCILSFTTRF